MRFFTKLRTFSSHISVRVFEGNSSLVQLSSSQACFGLGHTTPQQTSQGRVTIGSPLPFFVCIAAFIFLFAVGIRVKNYLSLETRRNYAPFFVRNREEFLRHAVTAVISTFIAGVIGYCLGCFLK
jgi:hypothetical protein